MVDPRYPHNVGAAIRAASCFGAKQVWFTGNRVKTEVESAKRITREERMKGYLDVDLIHYDRFLEQFKDATPVAVELRPNAELLPHFVHPENPLYVFGPEDGSIPQGILRHCHRFLVIPTKHCTNLAAAVYLILYDRYLKRVQEGTEEVNHISDVLDEHRGPISTWAPEDDIVVFSNT